MSSKARQGQAFACAAVISMTRNVERPFEIHAWRRGRRDEAVNGSQD